MERAAAPSRPQPPRHDADPHGEELAGSLVHTSPLQGHLTVAIGPGVLGWEREGGAGPVPHPCLALALKSCRGLSAVGKRYRTLQGS